MFICNKCVANTSHLRRILRNGLIEQLESFKQFVEEIEDSSGKAEVSILVADYLWKDSAVADREINFTACCLEIMETLELKQLF